MVPYRVAIAREARAPLLRESVGRSRSSRASDGSERLGADPSQKQLDRDDFVVVERPMNRGATASPERPRASCGGVLRRTRRCRIHRRRRGAPTRARRARRATVMRNRHVDELVPLFFSRPAAPTIAIDVSVESVRMCFSSRVNRAKRVPVGRPKRHLRKMARNRRGGPASATMTQANDEER